MSLAMAKLRAALAGAGSDFWLRDARAPAAVVAGAPALPLDRDGIARFDLRIEQGRIAACHAFDAPSQAPPEFFPYGIYSVPEMSTIGMTEEQVRAKNIPYECGVARFRETARGQIMGLSSGFMKLIFALETRRLLGAHIVGEGATELIHIGQTLMAHDGKIDYFADAVFNFPTLAECYKTAALDGINRLSV